ncbi:MAG TPA: sulfur carrier protein ThiS [Opitutaceae bacterium]|nr:sulfur carrier protein ThiS [Opitutaceae bacterium]
MSAAPTITVNDRPRALAAGATVASLLADLGLRGRQGVAVAINGAVVGRALWPDRALAAADRVLVIQATQGG